MWESILGLGLTSGLGLLKGKRQRKQQKKLNEQAAELNYIYGEKSAENAFGRQLQMYDRTYQDNSPANRVQQIEDAGLSPSLMYGSGAGAGGAGQATTAPQGSGAQGLQAGQASDEGALLEAGIKALAMKNETKRVNSEIRINKEKELEIQANADKAKAEADKARAETKTTDESREAYIEKLKQEGEGQWIENLKEDWFAKGGHEDSIEEVIYENDLYGVFGIHKDGLLTRERVNAVTKGAWETIDAENKSRLTKAMEILTNNKAAGYWQELLNATITANAAKTQAAAQKLATEWGTGEFKNWKTWITLGKDVLGQGVKAITGISLTKAIRK